MIYNMVEAAKVAVGKMVKSMFEDGDMLYIVFADDTALRMSGVSCRSEFGLGTLYMNPPTSQIYIVVLTAADLKVVVDSRRASIKAKLEELRTLPNIEVG